MALARAPPRHAASNYWPGFVDALSTLLLGIIFLLTVFVVVQFFLSQEVTGKDTALSAPQRADRAAHRSAVAREDRQGRRSRSRSRSCARTLRATESERDRCKGLYEGAAAASPTRRARSTELSGAARRRKAASRAARWRRSRCSTSRSRRCAASSPRSRTRSTSPRRRTRSRSPASPISASGSTSRWRSACRSCRAIAPTSSAGCARSSATAPTSASSATASCSSPRCSSTPARRCSSRRAAPSSTSSPRALLDLEQQDSRGHRLGAARRRPHRRAPDRGAQFKSNWDLSAARAISVVQYLISKGVSPQRLVAAGFGEFQPIDPDQHRGGLSAATAASS